MSHQLKYKLILLSILVLAFIFRFINLNWDQGTHLHPDERFLTMVGLDLTLPHSLSEYLNQQQSSMNPVNIVDGAGNKKYPFFVYGMFPLTVNKFFAIATVNDTYNGFTLTGRMLSAVFDFVVLLLIFRIMLLFEKHYHFDKKLKLWAVFFYAVAVLPFQLSHFFAVDTFLNTFIFTSWYFILEYFFTKRTLALTASAVSIGIAFACKITAVFMFPMLLLMIVLTHILPLIKNFRHIPFHKLLNKNLLVSILFPVILFILSAYVSLRFADPTLFEHPSLLNPQISKTFLQNIDTLKAWENLGIDYPPMVQWINRPPVIFALRSLVTLGLGIPYSLITLCGILYLLNKKRNPLLILSIFWTAAVFFYESVQAAQTIRYFIIIYPFLAIFSAFGIYWLMERFGKLIQYIAVPAVMIWPLAFLSVYVHTNSRIAASEWIYRNIPAGSTIAWELWDDPLPLSLPDHPNSVYTFNQVPVFERDSAEKWQNVNRILENSNYYILSSNRAWGSIPRLPEQYPITTNFYKDLFAGKRGFTKIMEFTSYPSLSYLGIPVTFPDDQAEETFTVYDHPKVLIFKKD